MSARLNRVLAHKYAWVVLIQILNKMLSHAYPDSKFNAANMGPTWVLSAPAGPHVGPMILGIRVVPTGYYINPCVYLVKTGSCSNQFKSLC